MTHYVNSSGIPELRKAISNKLIYVDGANYNDSQIIVTPGGKFALFLALKTIINPGDEVIILNPSWVSYEPLITMVGGVTVSVDLDQNDNFKLERKIIDDACTSRTKAIIINSPNNPTGRVLTKEEIGELRDVAIAKDLIVISDEVYDKLVYGDSSFVCIASIKGLTERTITIQSFSKGYAMTGWRLGYLALPNDLLKSALKVQQHILYCTAAFIQKAGVEALNGPMDEITKMTTVYKKRLEKVVTKLNQIPGVRCPMPEGAFYVFPEIEFRNYTSFQLADYLLEEVGVAVTPGEAFGSRYTKHIRLSCAESDELLDDALIRLERALK